MRIDKFLWCTRFYKTRNSAAQACKKGHIKINDNIAKASKEIFVCDKISIRKDGIVYQIAVTEIPTSRTGAKTVLLYYQDLTPTASYQHLNLLKATQNYYRKKGEGRPTKKDRRDLSAWTQNNSFDATDKQITTQQTSSDTNLFNPI